MAKENYSQNHSHAWVIQTWLSFMISISATTLGIVYLPVNGWIKGYMGMGLIFSVASTVSLTKTQRDLHESNRIIAKIEEAKVEKILAEHSQI